MQTDATAAILVTDDAVNRDYHRLEVHLPGKPHFFLLSQKRVCVSERSHLSSYPCFASAMVPRGITGGTNRDVRIPHVSMKCRYEFVFLVHFSHRMGVDCIKGVRERIHVPRLSVLSRCMNKCMIYYTLV